MSPFCVPVKSIWTIVVILGLAMTGPVHAQQSDTSCAVGSLALGSSSESGGSSARLTERTAVTNPTPSVSVTPGTEAEQHVQDVIVNDGLHVVHFWAPWSDNSKRELRNGWPNLVSSNPTVTFTFVTVWNDGQEARTVLNRYNIPARVTTVALPDLSSSDEESGRRRSFLGHPVTWVPSTWILHNNGELAFALNYGEMDADRLQSLLNVTRKEW